MQSILKIHLKTKLDFKCNVIMFIGLTSLPCAVVASMKEAQEKLTGDAFRNAHVGDEL